MTIFNNKETTKGKDRMKDVSVPEITLDGDEAILKKPPSDEDSEEGRGTDSRRIRIPKAPWAGGGQ